MQTLGIHIMTIYSQLPSLSLKLVSFFRLVCLNHFTLVTFWYKTLAWVKLTNCRLSFPTISSSIQSEIIVKSLKVLVISLNSERCESLLALEPALGSISPKASQHHFTTLECETDCQISEQSSSAPSVTGARRSWIWNTGISVFSIRAKSQGIRHE